MRSKLKHLDLFSGMGAFTIPAKEFGIETINFSEIDKYATAVLKFRFPQIDNLGDISRIDERSLPDFDLLTGGTPCQDLSLAGKRKGLTGERSGLFFHFIRILKQKQPRYFIWENVKGALSSNGGWDFARVQIEMEQAGYSIQWAILNAKDYSVPQNRERVFIVGTRGESQREVLPIRRNDKISASESESEQGQSQALISSTVRGSAMKADNTYIVAIDRGVLKRRSVVNAIDANYHKGVDNHQQRSVVMVREATKKGYALADAGDSISLKYPSSKTRRGRVGKGIAQTLDTEPQQAVVEPYMISNRYKGFKEEDVRVHSKVSPTIRTPKGGGHLPELVEGNRIRRLTPTECERLMGLPDGWTSKGIMGGGIVDISDTQRYKMCGNGVVVNVVREIYRLMFYDTILEK